MRGLQGRTVKLLAALLLGVVLGGFMAWQWCAWRVYVAEGLRDMALMTANKTGELCGHSSPWPARRR